MTKVITTQETVMSVSTEQKIHFYTGKSLFIEFPDEHSIRFDRESRWNSWQNGNALYRRTLDSKIVKVHDKKYTVVSGSEETNIIRDITNLTKTTFYELNENPSDFELPESNFPKITDWLNNALDWLSKSQEIEKRHFTEAYPEGIQILPPDRYRDLVIQPAFGCPSGKCTFCAFYKDNRFRVRSEEDFDQHLQDVKNLFGADLVDRNGIFLDSASALSLSQRRMIKILDTLNNLLPNNKRGIATFLDPNHAPKRNADDYFELKQLGLTQATIGLETGDPNLRKKLGKSDDLQTLKDTITALKKADIQIALTILIGAGGMDYKTIHRNETTKFIQDSGLSHQDIVYLSPLSGSLSVEQIRSEMTAFKNALKEITPAHISPYNMERFYYFG